ncbi:hypothetical protein M0Q50_02505 [bacterium]|nr:hypothetical protein [bacterium]
MKYYYKTNINRLCIEYCPINMKHQGNIISIGSWLCAGCEYIIDYDDKEKYVICKPIIENQRLKKLNSL